MSAPHPVYRSLVRLYPRDFRVGYGDDLVQHFNDLVSDRGAGAAWARTGVDLIVTIPRYRLERIMSEQHSATTLNVTVTLLAAAGIMSVLAGLYPGALLLVAAVVVAVAQRSTLARAIRTPDSNRRRRRLGTAAILGVVFLAAMASYMRAIGEEHVSGTSLVLHNAIGVPSMVGALVFLIAGLLTPKASDNRPGAPV
jgi:hypothetical protein